MSVLWECSITPTLNSQPTYELCPKCNQPIEDGQLITGQSWNGEGGEHITCPVLVEGIVGMNPDPAPDGVYVPYLEEEPELERATR